MLKKQRGLTMISWIVVLGLVGIQAVMALRIIPVYINYNSVKHIMDGLPEDPKATGLSTRELRKYLTKRLKIEGMYNLSDDAEAFRFVKTKSGVVLELDYEERGPILGNLEFVATFEYEVILPWLR